MDNRTIDVTSQDIHDLKHILEVIWKNAPGGKASHFKIGKLEEVVKYFGDPVSGHYKEYHWTEEGKSTLVLYWSIDKDTNPLPYSINQEEAFFFIKGWLENLEYPPEPDIDGSCKKGFRAFTDEHWGHVAGSHYGIIGVQPVWAMFGK